MMALPNLVVSESLIDELLAEHGGDARSVIADIIKQNLLLNERIDYLVGESSSGYKWGRIRRPGMLPPGPTVPTPPPLDL